MFFVQLNNIDKICLINLIIKYLLLYIGVRSRVLGLNVIHNFLRRGTANFPQIANGGGH